MNLSLHPVRALGLTWAIVVFPIVSLQAAQPHVVPGLALTLQPIPAGTFTMGSPVGEVGRGDNEGPPTRVAITRAFWLGQFEVTHGQWQALMSTDLVAQAKRMVEDDTPYDLGGKQQTIRVIRGLKRDSDPEPNVYNRDDDAPMYWVSWDEAAAFCRRLTERERAAGRLPGGYEFRLPTEAEWEYACRAGTTTATYAGDLEIKGRNNAPVLDAIAWYFGNSSAGYTGKGIDTAKVPEKQYPGGIAGQRKVGTRQPNAWGLHDTLGNVAEWCADWQAEKLPGGSVSDPSGPVSGTQRALRGGGWVGAPRGNRAARRAGFEPGRRHDDLGFRVALAPSLR